MDRQTFYGHSENGQFIKTDPIERFWSYVEKTDTCWNWKGFIYKRGGGYGGFKLENKHVKAHRYSFFLHNGYIDEKLMILHKCDNRLCVNPDHLQLGTHKENMLDMTNKNRQAKGEKCALSKLNEEQVIEIKFELKNYYRGICYDLADKYNVNYMTIYHIYRNKTWSHINI